MKLRRRKRTRQPTKYFIHENFVGSYQRKPKPPTVGVQTIKPQLTKPEKKEATHRPASSASTPSARAARGICIEKATLVKNETLASSSYGSPLRHNVSIKKSACASSKLKREENETEDIFIDKQKKNDTSKNKSNILKVAAVHHGTLDNRKSTKLTTSNQLKLSVTTKTECEKTRVLPEFGNKDKSLFYLVGEDIPYILSLNLFPSIFSSNVSRRDQYSSKPGITRWHPSKIAKKRRKTFGFSDYFPVDNEEVRYRARVSLEGTTFNLGGYHISSESAAAAIDLANLLLMGSTSIKPLHVLTDFEAIKGLKAAGINIQYGSMVQPYEKKIEEEQEKKAVEEKVEKALCALGGQDDFLANIMIGLDEDERDTAPDFYFLANDNIGKIMGKTDRMHDLSIDEYKNIV